VLGEEPLPQEGSGVKRRRRVVSKCNKIKRVKRRPKKKKPKKKKKKDIFS